MEDIDVITTTPCDTCSITGPDVLMHHHGVPVLAQCRARMPQEFERVARRDIDRWLGCSGAE